MHCFSITITAASMVPQVVAHIAPQPCKQRRLHNTLCRTRSDSTPLHDQMRFQGWFSHRRRKDKREKQEKEGAAARLAGSAGLVLGALAQPAASSQPRPPMPPPMAATAQQAQHHPPMRPMLPQPGSAVSMRPPPAMQQAVPQGQQPLPTGAWLGPMTGPAMRPPGGVPAGVAQMQAAMTPQQAAAYNQQLMQQHQLRMLQQQVFAAQQQQQLQQQRPPAQHQQQQAQLPQPLQPPQSAAQAAQAPQRAPPAQSAPPAALSQGTQPPVPQLAPIMPASNAYAGGPPTTMHAPVQLGGAAPAGHAAFQHAQHQQQMQQQQQAAYMQQQQQHSQPRPYLPASSLAPSQGPMANQQPPLSAAHTPNSGPAAQQMPPPSSSSALSQAQLLQRVQYFQAMQVRPCGFYTARGVRRSPQSDDASTLMCCFEASQPDRHPLSVSSAMW